MKLNKQFLLNKLYECVDTGIIQFNHVYICTVHFYTLHIFDYDLFHLFLEGFLDLMCTKEHWILPEKQTQYFYKNICIIVKDKED